MPPTSPLPKLPEEQARGMRYIGAYVIERGKFPTQRWVCDTLELKTTNPRFLIGPLVAKGYLLRSGGPGRGRRFELTKSALEWLATQELPRPVPADLPKGAKQIQLGGIDR